MYSADDITLETWTVTDLSTRVATLGSGPVALFIHGWPECWYSWRHQIVALANAGYRAVAPDMPGFGQTQALQQIDDYNVERICEFMGIWCVEPAAGSRCCSSDATGAPSIAGSLRCAILRWFPGWST